MEDEPPEVLGFQEFLGFLGECEQEAACEEADLYLVFVELLLLLQVGLQALRCGLALAQVLLQPLRKTDVRFSLVSFKSNVSSALLHSDPFISTINRPPPPPPAAAA